MRGWLWAVSMLSAAALCALPSAAEACEPLYVYATFMVTGTDAPACAMLRGEAINGTAAFIVNNTCAEAFTLRQGTDSEGNTCANCGDPVTIEPGGNRTIYSPELTSDDVSPVPATFAWSMGAQTGTVQVAGEGEYGDCGGGAAICVGTVARTTRGPGWEALLALGLGLGLAWRRRP